MPQGQFRLRLSPRHGGAFTSWRLCGCVATALPSRDMRRLMQTLSFWSGWPVELVLPAEVGTDAWFEWWADVAAGIPLNNLQVRFVLARHPTHGRGLSHDQ
jgi:hypothetical protein